MSKLKTLPVRLLYGYLYRCSRKRSACNPSSDAAFAFRSNLLPTVLFFIPLSSGAIFAPIIISFFVFALWLDQFDLLSHLITESVEEAGEEFFCILLPSLNHLQASMFSTV